MISSPPPGDELPAPPGPVVTGSIAPPPTPGVARSGPGGLPAVGWRWWEAFLVYVGANLLVGQLLVAGAIFALMGVSAADQSDGLSLVVATLGADLAFIGLTVAWLGWRHPGWRRAVGIVANAHDAAWGFGAGILLYPIVTIGVGLPLLALFRLLFGEQVTSPEQLAPDMSAGAKALAVVLAVAVAPVAEELFFRGMFFRSIRDRAGMLPGVALSALLFGAVHVVEAPWQDLVFLQTVMVATGAGLALIYERRANLAASIAAHMAFNTIGVFLILRAG